MSMKPTSKKAACLVFHKMVKTTKMIMKKYNCRVITFRMIVIRSFFFHKPQIDCLSVQNIK